MKYIYPHSNVFVHIGLWFVFISIVLLLVYSWTYCNSPLTPTANLIWQTREMWSHLAGLLSSDLSLVPKMVVHVGRFIYKNTLMKSITSCSQITADRLDTLEKYLDNDYVCVILTFAIKWCAKFNGFLKCSTTLAYMCKFFICHHWKRFCENVENIFDIEI